MSLLLTTFDSRETLMIRSLLNGALRSGTSRRSTSGYGGGYGHRGGGAGAAVGAQVGRSLFRRLGRR